MDDQTKTLPEGLKTAVESYSQKIAIEAETNQGFIKYTYQEFFQKAQSIAHTLIEFNINKGDRVSILLDNCPEWGFIYFGIMFAGATAVPLDVQSTPEDVEYFLSNSGSKLVLSQSKHKVLFSKIEKVPSLKKIIFIDEDDKQIFNQSPLTEIKPTTAPDEIASIIYTSGTTGLPKGVMLSHANLFANYSSIMELDFLQPDDSILALLPLHHAFPFMTTFLIPLLAGIRVVYPISLKSEELLRSIRTAKVTSLVAVPQFYYLFYRKIQKALSSLPWFFRLPALAALEIAFYCRKYCHLNISKIIFRKIHQQFGDKMRYFISGGAKLDSEAQRFFFKLGFNILEGYGLSETSPVVTMTPPKRPKLGSVGKPIPNVRVKILVPDSDGVGEVLIFAPNVMLGYFGMPDKTNEVFKDGWFCSGDLGYLDKDGYLFIVGRKNELIVLPNGKNINPEEVENHYAKNPFIKEICVLTAHQEKEEKLMAVIVPNMDYFRQKGEISVLETIKWHVENISLTLPPFKRIMGFVLAKKPLPRTHLGKLKRYLIKSEYKNELSGISRQPKETAAYSEEDIAILSNDTAQKVLEILTDEFAKDIRLDDHLELDLGIDSLKRLELLVTLEEVFPIKIPEQEASQIFTVRELIQTIETLMGKKKLIKSSGEKLAIWQEILNTEPPKSVTEKIDLSPNKWAKLAAFLFDGLLYVLFRITCRLKISGQENLPKDRAFILCSNHNSYLDGFIITAAIPENLNKSIFFLGILAAIKAPIIKNMQKIIRIIPISPSEQLVAAMQAGAYVLKHDKILVIFPEAARSIDGEIKEFKSGIGILAKETETPILPAYIKGSFESWPRNHRFPKPHAIEVVFGKLHERKELEQLGYLEGAKNAYEAIALGIRKKVIELKP